MLRNGIKKLHPQNEVREECQASSFLIKKSLPQKEIGEEYEASSFLIKVTVYFSYFVLLVFGHLRDFLRRLGLEKNCIVRERNREGYVPLYQSFESFFTRNIYRRLCHVINNTICSTPGATVVVKERVSHDFNYTFEFTGNESECINLASFNYLGMAENNGKCADAVAKCLNENGVGICSTRHELGTLKIHQELEKLTAEFLGVEDSIIVGMGFATNTTSIPSIISKGSLILSDKLNHASIAFGCRLSGAKVTVFKHNDMKDLEKKIRASIVYGQPKTHRPWKKIILLVEGLYSMEGTIVNLPGLLALKKKYKCYLYIDEAHCIGAIGPRGRGVTDYYGCDPKDVDLLMGTFSKSFAGYGGYIAGCKKVIQHLRRNSHSFMYANGMSAPVAQQILTSMKILMGKDGTAEGSKRIRQLRRNTHYFRKKLKQKGFLIYGNEDAPVVPLMLYFMSKVPEFVTQLWKANVAAVGVGFPATPLLTARARFCISAAHTKDMLDKVIGAVESAGRLMMVDYSKKRKSQEEIIY
ncbi:serine palmitoyltransferase 2-like [Uloborus diversus]|uniref:serine palmitoyltransferase 2-like n=1 Tax=Uloborus diversus TaxID=327109 RepID=UPI0024097AC3|nr:serine palmitoyltransferase 2-like [Uloborus diversus]